MTMTVNQAYNTMIGQVANAAYCIGCLGCKSELDLNIKITPIKSEIVNDQFHLRLSVDEYVLDILVGLKVPMRYGHGMDDKTTNIDVQVVGYPYRNESRTLNPKVIPVFDDLIDTVDPDDFEKRVIHRMYCFVTQYCKLHEHLRRLFPQDY